MKNTQQPSLQTKNFSVLTGLDIAQGLLTGAASQKAIYHRFSGIVLFVLFNLRIVFIVEEYFSEILVAIGLLIRKFPDPDLD